MVYNTCHMSQIEAKNRNQSEEMIRKAWGVAGLTAGIFLLGFSIGTRNIALTTIGMGGIVGSIELLN